LITVITFQYFFLISGFWSKARVSLSTDNFDFSDKRFNVWLSEENGAVSQTNGNTAVGAFKCALSIVVAFAAIMGKAGPLEALIMTIIGVVFYELNRQIISLLSVDFGGSMGIFCFGGFFGGVVALMLKFCKQK
jgi:hypothetical protein